MTFTYAGDPGASALASIRFLMGDTDTLDQLLSDEEINWVNLEVAGSAASTDAVYASAVRCLLAVASKFSRLADQSIGDYKVSLSQKAEAARAQAAVMSKELVAREGGTPVPYAGGISIDDKDIDRENPDRVDPAFAVRQFSNFSRADEVLSDNPGADY